MKFIFTTLALSLSLSAAAGDYVLQPGESRQLYMNGRWENVTCSDPATPKCRLERNGSWVTILAGQDEIAQEFGLDKAIAAVNKLKETGICR